MIRAFRLRRCLPAAAALLLMGPALVARADEPAEPKKVPADAPPGCLEPEGTDGFSPLLKRGPKKLGTYKLVSGKKLDTPGLRLKVSGKFIPKRLGSTEGEVLTGISVSLLPDVDRDGENPQNSVDESGLGPIRIASYRISVKPLPIKKGKPVSYEALVEEVGCPERAVHPPLAYSESKTFWISTEAVGTYAFSNGEWYDSGPEVYARISAGLDPDVQQTAGQPPHGWVAFQAWDNHGGLPESKELYLDQLEGAKLAMPGHQVEVLKVVLGPETTKDTSYERRVYTKGRQPVASALVRVTRNAAPAPAAPPPPPRAAVPASKAPVAPSGKKP